MSLHRLNAGETDGSFPRPSCPGRSKAKSSGSKVAFNASVRRFAAQVGAQPGELEDLRHLLWPEKPSHSLLAPTAEEVPVYDPEALVWWAAGRKPRRDT